MWRRLLAVTAALLFVLAAACDSGTDVELTYSIGPVEFAVDQNLEVSVSLGAEFVTPIGTFGISGGQTIIGLNTPEIEERRRDKLTLILRMTIKGKRVAKVYVIESGQKLRLEISGKTVQDYEKYGEQTTVTIDAAPGTKIKISPVQTIPRPTTTPTPVYRLAYENREVRISSEGESPYVGISLDDARVTNALDDMDLQWDSAYFEVKPDGITRFGFSSSRRPTPSACIADARAKAAGKLESDSDLRAGQAFCAVTAEGNPAWLKLVSVNGERTVLTFRITYWKATTAEALPEDLTSYALEYRDEEIQVAEPGVYGGPDLDLRDVRDDPDESVDILWHSGDGLEAGHNSSFGNSSTRRPSAKDCLADAHAKAVGEIAPEDLRVGQAFCVETDQGNVAWLKLTAKGSDSDSLTFSATLWRRAA